MSEPILAFEHFGFQYDAQASPTLYDINLTVSRGEKILIAGPSGCGKSTLAHCINGLIPFSYPGEATGSVTIKGRETKKMGLFEISRSVGTVLQDSDGQFIGLTVAEDIAFALENDAIGEPDLHQRVLKAARAVNIQDFLKHAPGELSGGQKQRVALAGVMVEDVDLLLFDEPLANLDPATGKQAIELIDQLHRETGAAVVIIEHRLEDVLYRHVDRVVLMSSGRIITDCSPDELLSSNSLTEHGIREPLYITALKYAGVEITPEMQPWNIDTIQLSQDEKNRVQQWFNAQPAPSEDTENPVLLEAGDIHFAYRNGRKALKGLGCQIRQGEFLAIAGTNGAGKSTFAKVICGFERPQQGKLLFRGQDLSEFSIKERADHIGYVMQNPNQMISKVMIFDEVALGLRTRGVEESMIRERVEEALKICGLWPFRNWPVSALSYGQKKRVTIASILVLKPEIILLDEPTAGQDYRHYTEIMDFLTQLNHLGITVVVITHDMHLMLEYSHRSLVFSEGNIIADADAATVLTDQQVIQAANLKETSLYQLAEKCGIQDGTGFVRRFINYERECIRP
ncbi:MAG: ABC transporter ATP-binding protein [Lachnospiraceae bacterium]|nr:ABC transporter ATP-binding protein [Lachnospiraceae bacterium]